MLNSNPLIQRKVTASQVVAQMYLLLKRLNRKTRELSVGEKHGMLVDMPVKMLDLIRV